MSTPAQSLAEPFCSNPDCLLHVREGDPGVQGSGNWAQLGNGRIVGRGIYIGLYFCDDCRREWRAVTVPPQRRA